MEELLRAEIDYLRTQNAAILLERDGFRNQLANTRRELVQSRTDAVTIQNTYSIIQTDFDLQASELSDLKRKLTSMTIASGKVEQASGSGTIGGNVVIDDKPKHVQQSNYDHPPMRQRTVTYIGLPPPRLHRPSQHLSQAGSSVGDNAHQLSLTASNKQVMEAPSAEDQESAAVGHDEISVTKKRPGPSYSSDGESSDSSKGSPPRKRAKFRNKINDQDHNFLDSSSEMSRQVDERDDETTSSSDFELEYVGDTSLNNRQASAARIRSPISVDSDSSSEESSVLIESAKEEITVELPENIANRAITRPQDQVPTTDDRAFILPAATVAQDLIGVSVYSIDPPPQSLAVRRDFLWEQFKGNHVSFIQDISYPPSQPGLSTKRRLFFPPAGMSPFAPKKPGAPGVILSSRDDVFTNQPVSLFVCLVRSLWWYVGEYTLSIVRNLSAQEFAGQRRKAQGGWAKTVLTATWPSSVAIRERICDRLNHGPDERLTVRDVIDAYTNGEEQAVMVISLKCVKYDHQFMDDIEKRWDIWNAPDAQAERANKSKRKRDSRVNRNGGQDGSTSGGTRIFQAESSLPKRKLSAGHHYSVVKKTKLSQTRTAEDSEYVPSSPGTTSPPGTRPLRTRGELPLGPWASLSPGIRSVEILEDSDLSSLSDG